MRIERLTLDSFKSYEHADVDLAGVSLASVVGPNGAGKSSLLEACVFALTGGRSFRNLDSYIRQGAEECRVSLVFRMGDARYRLTRTRSNRNSGKSTVEFCREEAGLWVAEGSGVKEMDSRIEEVLGIDESTLMLTSIVAQGDAGSFLSLRPAQRLEALGEILRLDKTYGPLERHFKTKAEAAKLSLGKTRGDIERLESSAAAIAERETLLDCAERALQTGRAALDHHAAILTEARERARVAQDGLRDVAEARRRLSDLEARRSELSARRAALERELAQLAGRVKEKPALEDEAAKRAEIEEDLACLAEAEKADTKTRQQGAVLEEQLRAAEDALLGISEQGKPAQAELERTLVARDAVRAKMDTIESACTPTCDRCGQPIKDDALDQTLDQLHDEYMGADYRAGNLQIQVQALRDEFAARAMTVKDLGVRLAALPSPSHDPAEERWLRGRLEVIDQIPAKLAEIAALEERQRSAMADLRGVSDQLQDPALARELDAAEAAVAESQALADAAAAAEREIQDAEHHEEGARRDVSTAEQEVARHEEALQMLRPDLARLNEARGEAKILEENLADAELLRKAFSKWGVPALIIGNVLLALECEVNDLLALYEGGLAVRFESEKETRDGSRDSLEILVYDGQDWRPYETFSGGERYRVASAMRLGLAQLLAHRAGARVETLIVDEPEGLDVDGRQHLARILERMSEHFGLVLLLTHYADLQDAMPSQVIVSRGEDGLSRVEVAA